MKKIYLMLMLVFGLTGFAQNGISYQALIINPSEQQIPGVNESGAPLSNKLICLRFSIIDQNMQFEYIETHKITTDAFGIVNLVIGSGQQIGGYASSFSNIIWDGNAKSLKVDLDVNAICTYYVEISNKPFTTIPFAYYAANSNVQNATTTSLGIVQLSGDLSGTATAPTVPGLATKENLINKSTATSLGTSDVLYPSQNAVKTYVDSQIATTTAIAQSALNGKENIIAPGLITDYWRGDKTWQPLTKASVGLGNVDNTSDLNKPISTATQTALNLKEDIANKSTSIATDAASNSKYPTVKATKDYIDSQVLTGTPDATNSVKGKIKLTNHLGGTADAPTVPGLAMKEELANKSTTITLGVSDVLYPTQNAVKTYVDTQLANAAAVNQTALNGKEDVVNKSTSIATDASSNSKYPSVKALVDYVTYSDVKSLNANYLATTTDFTLLCDANTTSFSITLPIAAPVNKGKVFIISKIDDTNNSITFIPSLKLTNASFVSSFNYATTIRVQSDGSNWVIIN